MLYNDCTISFTNSQILVSGHIYTYTFNIRDIEVYGCLDDFSSQQAWEVKGSEGNTLRIYLHDGLRKNFQFVLYSRVSYREILSFDSIMDKDYGISLLMKIMEVSTFLSHINNWKTKTEKNPNEKILFYRERKHTYKNRVIRRIERIEKIDGNLFRLKYKYPTFNLRDKKEMKEISFMVNYPVRIRRYLYYHLLRDGMIDEDCEGLTEFLNKRVNLKSGFDILL